LPPTADLGPGSPSGITFGYATSFPPEYRNNLFMCDWSFGRIYAAALRPQGASYRADVREFVTGTPLPVTDIVANPSDGALYFAIGGRRTQSALYRVVYTGPPTDSSGREELPGEAKLRRSLEEELHGSAEAQQIDRAWPHLRHADRFVRFTARTVIEAGPIAIWQERALREQDPWGRIEALVAWARCSDSPDANLWNAATARLLELDWTALAPGQRLSALRAIELILIRGGSATKTSRAELLRHLCSLLPTEDIQLRRRVAFLRSFLGDTQAIHGMLQEMETASTQEEQIAFAYGLRQLIGKGTLDEQRRYFQWYLDSHDLHGGSSLRGFLDLIRGDSVSELGEEALGELADLIATPIVEETTTPTTSSLPLIKQYSIQDVVIAGAKFDRSATLTEARAAFSKGLCFRCHRVGLEGGSTGPDLTTAHRRFSRAYIAESLVVPDSEVSDRYRSSSFVLKNGKTISGRVANMSVNDIRVVTDMLRPGDFAKIERKDIAEIRPQARSEMPSGLLDGLTEKEIGAIFAYLDSEGNPDSPVFQNELK
jgi:putative heme-binding domain-containing protein